MYIVLDTMFKKIQPTIKALNHAVAAVLLKLLILTVFGEPNDNMWGKGVTCEETASLDDTPVWPSLDQCVCMCVPVHINADQLLTSTAFCREFVPSSNHPRSNL